MRKPTICFVQAEIGIEEMTFFVPCPREGGFSLWRSLQDDTVDSATLLALGTHGHRAMLR